MAKKDSSTPKVFSKITKENGRIEDYDFTKGRDAILRAMTDARKENKSLATKVAKEIEQELLKTKKDEFPTSDEWSQCAIEVLQRKKMNEVCAAYAEYRYDKSLKRLKNSDLMKSFRDVLMSSGDNPDSINTENANIDGFDPAAQLHRIGSESNKNYVLNYLLPKNYAKTHIDKWLHIHDMDYFELNFNCLQVDLTNMLKDGFDTGTGLNKEPRSVQTAAMLAAIVMQSCTNQQHGGIAIMNLDFALAKYVNVSFRKEFKKAVDDYYTIQGKSVPSFIDSNLINKLYYGINIEDVVELDGESKNILKNVKSRISEDLKTLLGSNLPEKVTYRIDGDTYKGIPIDLAIEHFSYLASL